VDFSNAASVFELLELVKVFCFWRTSECGL